MSRSSVISASPAARRIGLALGLCGIVASVVAAVVGRGGVVVDTVGSAVILGIWVALPLVALPLVARTPLVAAAGGVLLGAGTAAFAFALARDESSTAGIGVLVGPLMLLVGLAVVAGIDRVVVLAATRAVRTEALPAGVGDRLAALAVDGVLVWVVVGWPVRALSHAGQEPLALAIGVTAAVGYLALAVHRRGHTVGHWLFGLEIVDSTTGERVPLGRAVMRSLVIVLEVLGAALVLLAPVAIVDAMTAVGSGVSLADRLARTRVVAHRATPPSNLQSHSV